MSNAILSKLAATVKAAPAKKSDDAAKADTAKITVEDGEFVLRFPVRAPRPSSSGKCSLIACAVLHRGAQVEGVPIAGTFTIRLVG